MAYNKYGAIIPDSAVSIGKSSGNGSGGVVSAKSSSVQSGSSSPGSSGKSTSSAASSLLKGLTSVAAATAAVSNPALALKTLTGLASSAAKNTKTAGSSGSASNAGGASGGYNYNGNTTLQTNDRVGGITRDQYGTPYAQTGASLSGHGLHDYVNDTTDYTTLALNSKSVEELQTRLAERAMKAEAQGLDISGSTPGYRSNAEIAAQWRRETGQYLPSNSGNRSGTTGRTGTATTSSGRGTANGGYYGGAANSYGSGGYGGSYGANGSYGGYGENDLAAQLMQLYNGQNSMYAQALAEQRAAQEAAVKRAVNELEGQKTTVDQQYSNLYRQAYIDRMNAQKDLSERLAAQGLTGGASESTMLGLNTAYTDALRQARQQQLREQNEIDRAISDTRYSGDVSIAQAAADAIRNQTDRQTGVLQNLLNYYDTLAARQEAYDREDEQREWNRQYQQSRDAVEDARYQAQLDADSASESRAWARQVAQALLNQGSMPDDDTLAAAGLTREQALALLPRVEETPAYTPTFSQAQVLDAANRGRLTGTLLRDYNWYIYGDPGYR